jgi:hypothetical protein
MAKLFEQAAAAFREYKAAQHREALCLFQRQWGCPPAEVCAADPGH